MDRRSFIKSAGAGLAGLACAPALRAQAQGANPERPPNIVYILADDAGYGDLSCYGQEKFSTPNIDRLAEGGMKFTQHYAGSTVCAPSRSVLMTGKHTGRTPIRGNREHQPVGQEPLPADTATVAKLLQEAGYATGAFGKWGLGYPGSEGEPLRQGFDRFYGYNCQRNAHTYYPTWLFDDDEQIELDGETYAHDLIMDKTLEWVREVQDQPFFLFVPTLIPHAAMQVPEEYHQPFREQFPEFEDVTGQYAGTEVPNPVAGFAGMMTKLDEDVGRIMALLNELGLDDNTIIMFTSDNGPHEEGGHDPEFFNSGGGLRGLKRDLYEGGIRVPFLARWPGKIPAGTVSDHMCAFWDFMPTACELAGIDVPAGIDGISHLPAFLAEPGQRSHKYLYWEFYERGGRRAVRWGDWKGVQYDVSANPDGPMELYNLADDLAEEHDLAEDHPEVVAVMQALIEHAHEPSEIWSWS